MTQVFILGSSSGYGVGASSAGWGDLTKQYVHSKMYDENGIGEKYEVYNLCKSGATIDFVQNNFHRWTAEFGRSERTIILVCVGGNNSKAEDQPDNFVSTIEDYTQQMATLLDTLKSSSYAVISVGNGFVDETKTNPKPNPLTGGASYFTNQRRQDFSERTKQLCNAREITFVDINIGLQEWLDTYMYDDGLHPNQAGHQLIFDSLKPALDQVLDV